MESISFFDNLLSQVPRAVLSNVQNLRFLDLNKKPIQRIQKGDFKDVMHLKELDMSSMPELVSIDSLALDNLPELTELEATNNPRLSFIHPRSFYRLPSLETLMLNDNALSVLHADTVASLSNLREVSLHSNPIRCDGIIRWVNINRISIHFMEPLICAEPPEFPRPAGPSSALSADGGNLPTSDLAKEPPRASGRGLRKLHVPLLPFGEPEPQIYWLLPSGHRFFPGTVSNKYNLHPEGTLEIYGATEQEAGLYTCTAHSLVGADLKTVTVAVGSYVPDLF